MLQQARHHLNEVARPRAVVQLRRQYLVPSRDTSTGRARQAEQVGTVGNAAEGAGLKGRRADFRKGNGPKNLAETIKLFLQQHFDGLRGTVKAGNASTAGSDNRLHIRISDPARNHSPNLKYIIGHDGLFKQPVARFCQPVDQQLA